MTSYNSSKSSIHSHLLWIVTCLLMQKFIDYRWNILCIDKKKKKHKRIVGHALHLSERPAYDLQSHDRFSIQGAPPTLSFHWRDPSSNGFRSPFGTRDVKILNSIHFKSIIIVHIIIVCIHFPWLAPHDSPKFPIRRRWRRRRRGAHAPSPCPAPSSMTHVWWAGEEEWEVAEMKTLLPPCKLQPMLSNYLKPRPKRSFTSNRWHNSRLTPTNKLVLPLGLHDKWKPFALSLVTMSHAKCKGHLINACGKVVGLKWPGFFNRTPRFDWYVVRWGSKSSRRKDTCQKGDWTISSNDNNYSTFN